MEVTFTKVDGRRYVMAARGTKSPELAPTQGPGYHDFLPHDVVHFLVESEAGLTGGVFGRVAAGRSTLFPTADKRALRHHRRRVTKRQLTKSEHEDMARSEFLAGVCTTLWELRTGRRGDPPEWFSSVDPETFKSAVVEQVLRRLDDFAARWSQLPVGGAITLDWSSQCSGHNR